MLQYSPVGILIRTCGPEIIYYSKIANFTLRGHEILRDSPVKLFQFVDMKYRKVLQLNFPLCGHEILYGSSGKRFHFLDMKQRRVLQLNFSISRT